LRLWRSDAAIDLGRRPAEIVVLSLFRQRPVALAGRLAARRERRCFPADDALASLSGCGTRWVGRTSMSKASWRGRDRHRRCLGRPRLLGRYGFAHIAYVARDHGVLFAGPCQRPNRAIRGFGGIDLAA